MSLDTLCNFKKKKAVACRPYFLLRGRCCRNFVVTPEMTKKYIVDMYTTDSTSADLNIWSQSGLLLRSTVSDHITDMDLNNKNRGKKTIFCEFLRCI